MKRKTFTSNGRICRSACTQQTPSSSSRHWAGSTQQVNTLCAAFHNQPCSWSLQSRAVSSSLRRSSVPPKESWNLKFQETRDSGHPGWDLHAVLLQHRGASWERLKKTQPLNHRNSLLSRAILCAVTPPDLRSFGWFLLQTHSPVQPEFVQPKKPQHKVPTDTETVAGTYKTWITGTNAKLWLLLRRFRNERLMRLTPLDFDRSLPGQSN